MEPIVGVALTLHHSHSIPSSIYVSSWTAVRGPSYMTSHTVFPLVDCLLIQGCQPQVQNIIEINKQKRSNPQHCKKGNIKAMFSEKVCLKKTIKRLVFLSFV